MLGLSVNQRRDTQRHHEADEVASDVDNAAAQRVSDAIFLRLLNRKLVADKNHGQHEEADAAAGSAKHLTARLRICIDEESQR